MNESIADKLREAAALLEAQGADVFRVRAYRRAADTVASMTEDADAVLEREGPAGLERLPNVGKGIAAAIAEMVLTGGWTRLARLRGELDPTRLFRAIPGVGPELAARIHDTLHVDTLEALEAAAHDGRLESVDGVGPRRAASMRATLDTMLRRVRGAPHTPPAGTPMVALLLDVDRDYRERAAHGELLCIAPKRFNPSARRWLPIMHVDRGDWHFTALYSNTARTHQLGRTGDWVVLYFYDGDHREGQCTVVTETRGRLRGRRVVRGREADCFAHYGV